MQKWLPFSQITEVAFGNIRAILSFTRMIAVSLHQRMQIRGTPEL
jgi:hypothetical protein